MKEELETSPGSTITIEIKKMVCDSNRKRSEITRLVEVPKGIAEKYFIAPLYVILDETMTAFEKTL